MHKQWIFSLAKFLRPPLAEATNKSYNQGMVFTQTPASTYLQDCHKVGFTQIETKRYKSKNR